MSDGERGILTEADREYLRGEKDLSEGSEFNTKRRIRDRVRRGILDFTVLFEHLDDEEADKIFKTEGGAFRYEDRDLWEGTRDALAFLLYHHGITDFMRRAGAPIGLAAEELLAEAYSRAGLKDEFLVEDVERPQIEATRLRNVLRELERGEDMSHWGLAKVVESGEVDDETLDEVQQLVRESLFDDE